MLVAREEIGIAELAVDDQVQAGGILAGRDETAAGTCHARDLGERRIDVHHVLDRLEAGATLVQGYTAFIYEGPLWARAINRGLVRAGYRTPRA